MLQYDVNGNIFMGKKAKLRKNIGKLRAKNLTLFAPMLLDIYLKSIGDKYNKLNALIKVHF